MMMAIVKREEEKEKIYLVSDVGNEVFKYDTAEANDRKEQEPEQEGAGNWRRRQEHREKKGGGAFHAM